MALRDKHQLKFNSHKDAKTLMEAIKKRFGGNTETKKVQKTFLKQQYENFTGSSSESLDQIHDRLQKLVSQLEIHGVSLSQEDVNLKFLRSTATQNLAFVSSSNTDNTTESLSVAASVSVVCTKMPVSSLPNVDSLSNAMAMLTMRARRFLQKTGKNLGANGPTSMGFDMSKVECYNCHMKGHFARECRSPKDSRRNDAAEPQRRTVPVETTTSNALVSQCDGVGSYDWSYQAEEKPANYAFMAFSSSSSSFDNEVPSCSKACSKAYAQLHSQYDKLTDDFCKSQFDVISYQTGLESVEARLLVYKQNEYVFEENIKLLNIEVQLRDTALVTLRQKLEKAEQEKDDLKLKLEKFQTSYKNLTELLASQTNKKTGLGYNSQVFTRAMFDCDDYLSSESDCESWPPTSLYDWFQLSDGYHVVSLPYTGTFMPPKPDVVFNSAPTAVETNHSAFTDWVSDSEDESETKAPQIIPSFVQSSEQVKSPRHYVRHAKTTIPATTPKPASPKPASSGKRMNRKACFVCKSVDHLIKDCDYHAKKMAQPTPRNHAHRGNHKQNAPLTHTNPQKHMVPTAVLTQSQPVSITAVRPVSADVPKFKVTQLRHTKPSVTKSKSPIRRHLTCSHSPKTSNSPPRVTVVKAPVVSAAQGMQEKWEWRPKCPILDHVSWPQGNPQHALKDTGVIDSGCSRHMIGNMSYLSEFEEPNGGYVAFGGNPKGGKISGKGKIKTGKLDFDDVYFVKELKFNLFSVSQMYNKKNSVLFTDTECLVLSPDFKMPDESHVLLRVPRENNMLHMDLFGPTFVKSLNKKSYCLVVTDDYSRFTWVFFLATKDETSSILKTFITGLENQLSLKVKVIRSDNRTEFKNHDLNQFCRMKGIKREFSVPRTPQQNRIVERKNKTLIKAARTMLADSLLPIIFWAKAVNTTCYVQNRVLVTKPHNKTPYELLHGRTPSIGFMRPFGYLVTIFNTLDSLGKFEGKVDE
nr:putative ribonuclease H-like domain-containing protein [Tanacetum cinerariifolium]